MEGNSAPPELGREDVFQTPPKAQHTFRRKTRESILSPGSLRASKIIKHKDEDLFERMHTMIRVETILMKTEMEKELQNALVTYKQEIFNTMKKEFDKELANLRVEIFKEIKGELTHWVRTETEVLKAVTDKIDDANQGLFKWKKETDIKLEETTKNLKEIEGQLKDLAEKQGTKETTQEHVTDSQLQEEIKELKSNLEKGMNSWTNVVKQHEDNTKWIEGARKEKNKSPQLQEEVQELKTNLENERKSWTKVVQQHEDNTKWIERAKIEKNIEPTSSATIINLTLEEEEKRRKRALHVRITGLKDTDKVEEEVTGLLKQMNITETTHTGAWRVGKKGVDKEGKPRDRALIMRFPNLEARKEFLKKRPALKKTGIFLGDDLTLAQVAHMQEKMPEIRAAREQGKIAFYRGGKVIIIEENSS